MHIAIITKMNIAAPRISYQLLHLVFVFSPGGNLITEANSKSFTLIIYSSGRMFTMFIASDDVNIWKAQDNKSCHIWKALVQDNKSCHNMESFSSG